MKHAPLPDVESGQRFRGIGLICLAVATLSCLDGSAKYAVLHGVPPLEVAWFRYALSLVFTVILLYPLRRSQLVSRRPVLQILRALFLLGSTVLNFLALQYLPLAVTTSLTFAAPLVVTAFAGPVLGEWAGPRRWAAVIVGFIGVLIVVQPQPSTFHPAVLLALGNAVCYAGYSMTTRLLSHTESTTGLLLYGSLVAALFLSPVMPVLAVAPPDWLAALALVVAGLAGTVGHWLLIQANRHAPATVLAPFSYLQILTTTAIGFILFGDIPSLSTSIGASIIIASGLYVLYRERVHHDR